MDKKLYNYFTYGVDDVDRINNDDELVLHDNFTNDDDVDTWLNMLDNYQRSCYD